VGLTLEKSLLLCIFQQPPKFLFKYPPLFPFFLDLETEMKIFNPLPPTQEKKRKTEECGILSSFGFFLNSHLWERWIFRISSV